MGPSKTDAAAASEEISTMGQRLKTPDVALVVEDDTELRYLAVALLEETDLRVEEASSAEEALQYLRDHADEVALLFADVRLPCLMNGVDLARTVRLKWPWVRTILTSGQPLASDDGVPRDVRFIPKPWRALDVLMEAERASKLM
jgi:CheY-like chemotaxis protein